MNRIILPKAAPIKSAKTYPLIEKTKTAPKVILEVAKRPVYRSVEDIPTTTKATRKILFASLYSPNNAVEYAAAAAGAMAGMISSGRQIISNNPLSYSQISAIAQAFAQEFDIQWGVTTPSQLAVQAIQSACEAAFQDRAPLPSDNSVTTPSNWTSLCQAIIASIQEIETVVTSPNWPTGGGVSGVTGTAPIVSSGGGNPAISINAATDSTAGSMSAADKTKLDGITAGAAVSAVTGTAPIVSSGGPTPAISINAATDSTAGSMSAADKTKLDGITAGAAVSAVTATAPITSSGGDTPAVAVESSNANTAQGTTIALTNTLQSLVSLTITVPAGYTKVLLIAQSQLSVGGVSSGYIVEQTTSEVTLGTLNSLLWDLETEDGWVSQSTLLTGFTPGTYTFHVNGQYTVAGTGTPHAQATIIVVPVI